jgi:hypothetical protein
MPLGPHPYLLRIRDALREAEPGRWKWFASDEWTADYVEAVRLELLKATYRMEPAAHGALYAIGARAAAALGLDVPVTFYQAQDDGAMNAGLYFIPGEAHVVLRGRVLSTLREEEIAALVGHELAHYGLSTCEGGSVRVATEVIESIASHPGATPSHLTTALRMRRYSEIYADRGSHLVTSNPADIVACLVKVNTGLTEVDPAAYMRQAEEIFAKKTVSAQGLTHPETFVRARAIALWHERGQEAEAEIATMVQGPRSMDALDLLDQQALTESTRLVIENLLAPGWFRSDAVLAHARSFFPELTAPRAGNPLDAGVLDKSVQEYLAYVLFDFAVVDEALGEAALAHTLRHAEAMGIGEPFERIARDEMKLTKRSIEELRKKAPAVLERAEAQHAVES